MDRWKIEYDSVSVLRLWVAGPSGELENVARSGQVGGVEVLRGDVVIPRAAWHVFSEALHAVPGDAR